MKEQDITLEKELNEGDINNLSRNRFKVKIIEGNSHKDVRGVDEHRISIELEDIKNNQKELKNTITETKTH